MVIYSFPALQVSTAGLATEPKQDSQITLATSANTKLDTVNTNIGSTNTKLDTANTNLDTINTNLSNIDAGIPAALGQTTMAASMPITIASNQSALPVTLTSTTITGSVAVTGTITANAGTNLNTSALALDSTVAKDASLSTLNTSVNTLLKPASTLAAVTTVGAVTAITNALPTGANVIGALTANQSVNAAQINGVTPLMGNGVTGTGSLRVTLASDTTSNTNALLVKQAGKTAVNKVRNDYTSSSVTTGAYVQLLTAAAFTTACTEVEIFDSSGQTLFLATGAAASEVDQVYILPGGNGRIPLAIAASTRISVKAVSATASVGELTINFYS